MIDCAESVGGPRAQRRLASTTIPWVRFDTSIVGNIDTVDAARAILRPTVGMICLKDLLAKLGLVIEGCHVRGNAANLTLRALLLLAVEGYRTSEMLNELQRRGKGSEQSDSNHSRPCRRHLDLEQQRSRRGKIWTRQCAMRDGCSLAICLRSRLCPGIPHRHRSTI